MNNTKKAVLGADAAGPGMGHNNPPSPVDMSPLAEDLLSGAKAIAEELGWPLRKVFHGLEKGYLPATKLGGIWTSTRSQLRRHFGGGVA